MTQTQTQARKVKKTLIEKTGDLKPGDVVIIHYMGAQEKNPSRPAGEFFKIQVVVSVETVLSSGDSMGHVCSIARPHRLTSDNGEHLTVNAAWLDEKITNGARFDWSFVESSNLRDAQKWYRLDNVRDIIK